MSLPIRDIFSSLKQNHIAILTNLDDIRQAISSTLELTRKQYLWVKPQLRGFEAALFNHFQLQSKDLYAQLLISAGEGSIKDIEFLVEDLKDFKVKTLMFFDDHPADMGDLSPRNFRVTFYAFADYVQARMNAERDFLFPLLEKISQHCN